MAAMAAAAAIWGAVAAWHYHRLGLTLSHYDARGHLIVARRIVDSITPGWQQVGAVWLPLPHLLNALPVQTDFFYRTGASGVMISIASFVLTVVSIAWIVEALSGSLLAGAAAAGVFAANPSVLYLQATPMTEPLLLGLTTFAVALLIDDSARDARAPDRGAGLQHCVERNAESGFGTTGVGIAFALACLTRYEAWTVTAAALACAAWARWRAGYCLSDAIGHVARIAAFPAATICAFMIFSRIVVGEWFVSSGFFTPENTALGRPFEAVKQIAWGMRALSGVGLASIAGGGVILLVAVGLLNKRRGSLLVAASFLATAAVPWYAFLKGHPYRIRYMVPLMAAEAIAAGVAAGYVKRARLLAVTALVLVAAVELRPFDLSAPMVVEAQWDRPNFAGRQPVSSFLRANYDGTTIMASMGRSATTCRTYPTRDSRSETSSTKATATSG